jgi:trans-2,3-dihydro-3-hydroxyanthranilate isomerase
MDNWTFRTVDVFTDRPLEGNQLAVFEDASAIPEPLLQPLAREIGFSESVFLYSASGDGDARMRIFTPSNEVPFAGHPTLGTAVLLAQRLGKDAVVLETGRGPVPVSVERTAGPALRGTMQQPIPAILPFAEPNALLDALRVRRSEIPIMLYDNGIPHVYVMLERPEMVAALQPDGTALTQLTKDIGLPMIGFNVFSGDGLVWKTRMFAPADGIFEDPATGSAAGPLALHLARHGLVPWGAEIAIAQGAEVGRPSQLLAKASLIDNTVGRIEVGGFAVPVGGGWFDPGVMGVG